MLPVAHALRRDRCHQNPRAETDEVGWTIGVLSEIFVVGWRRMGGVRVVGSVERVHGQLNLEKANMLAVYAR